MRQRGNIWNKQGCFSPTPISHASQRKGQFLKPGTAESSSTTHPRKALASRAGWCLLNTAEPQALCMRVCSPVCLLSERTLQMKVLIQGSTSPRDTANGGSDPPMLCHRTAAFLSTRRCAGRMGVTQQYLGIRKAIL